MELTVMDAAERHRKFVADLLAHRARLRKANVMRIGWGPAAEETRLLANEEKMVLVSCPPRMRDQEVRVFGECRTDIVRRSDLHTARFLNSALVETAGRRCLGRWCGLEPGRAFSVATDGCRSRLRFLGRLFVGQDFVEGIRGRVTARRNVVAAVRPEPLERTPAFVIGRTRDRMPWRLPRNGHLLDRCERCQWKRGRR